MRPSRTAWIIVAAAALTSCRLADSMRDKWDSSRSMQRFVDSLEFTRFVHAEIPTDLAGYVTQKEVQHTTELPQTIARGLGTAGKDLGQLLTPPDDIEGKLGRRINSLVESPRRIELLRGGLSDPSDPERETGAGPIDPTTQKSQIRRIIDRLRF